MPAITAGRICLSIEAALGISGPFLADWNHTHVFNPKWPPHAKFHNGQTMTLGVLLGLSTLFYTWRSGPKIDLDSIRTAAVFGSLYWIAGLCAELYPGALAMDPEFGTGHPQIPMFTAVLGLSWLGYWLEARRVAEVKI